VEGKSPVFETLSQKLEIVFKKLRGEGRLSEENITNALREVRRALLDADVHYTVAKDFVDAVGQRALGRDVLTSITPGQLIVKIVHEEMVKLLGTSKADIAEAQTPPTIVLVAGLQGSGKTTLCAKLARSLKSKGRNPLLAAADIYRPAAIEQLMSLGRQLAIPVYTDRGADAVTIARNAVDHARKNMRDTVVLDTAGRLHIDQEMMQEIAAIRDTVRPHEILFVVDAMTGQDAVTTAKAFFEQLSFDGVVLTKMDGDARGGAALSIRSVIDRPVKFMGVGEKLDALEPFYPDRIASRILGMGDVVTLVEKAQEQFDHQQSAKLEEKLRKAQLTLEDFLEQLRQIKTMGPLDQVLAMVPGMNRLPAGAQLDDRALGRIEAIIQSMTTEERSKPSMINGSRRRRIALGSGTTVQEVNRLLKQFDEMQKMMKKFLRGNLRRTVRGMNFPIN
jgi:signal recognition particle subunit SRP54